MLIKNLIRWSGMAAMIGAFLMMVATVVPDILIPGDELTSVVALSGAWIPLWALFLIGLILIALGLVGLYARQAERAGVFGLVAFLVAFTGVALALGLAWTFLFTVPSLAEAAPAFLDNEEIPGPLALAFPLTFILFDGGWLLFGLATALAKVFPRWAGILLMIGAVLDFSSNFLPISFPIGTVLLGAALIWLGYLLWSEHRQTAIRPEATVEY